MYTMEPIRFENGPTRTVEFTVHDDLLLFVFFVLQTGNIYKYIYVKTRKEDRTRNERKTDYLLFVWKKTKNHQR